VTEGAIEAGVTEARLEHGVPVTAGWFVVNARDARWLHNDMRAVCRFGGEGEAHFDDLGIGLYWIQPGKPMSLYHHEAGKEDFLILRGECIVLVEGRECAVAAWDFFHCPPRTAHTIVARRHDRRAPGGAVASSGRRSGQPEPPAKAAI